MDRLNIYGKVNTYIYEIFLVLIIVFHYGGILYTNSFLSGADISDFVNLKSNTIQTAAFKSANLPVYYLFEFLYHKLSLSNEFIKAIITLFCLVVIVFSIYKITLYIFNNKLSGILAVILFLYSSLYFPVLFSNLNFIDDANPDALSYSFLMLGIFYWLKERYKVSSMFMGLSFGSHPILPIGVIIAFFIEQLINYKKIGIKNILKSLLLFLFVTFPVTFNVIKVAAFTMKGAVTQELDAELIWKYVRFAQPQSAFIDVIPQFHYGLSLYFSSFLFLLLLYNYGDKDQKEKYSKLFLLTFTVFSFTIFELLNSYYLKIIPLYNLWFHRFMTYGSVITYIILAGGVFYAIREKRINYFLKICLFLLLCFSVFAQELNADLYMTFWANHFYILEIVIIYYLYNISSKEKLPFKILAINLIFLAGALIYFYHIAVYNRFAPGLPIFDLFQWGNGKHFLEVVLYRQFEYAYSYNFYQGIYILLVGLVCFGVVYLFKFDLDVEGQENVKSKMIFRLAVVGILSIGIIIASIWVLAVRDNSAVKDDFLNKKDLLSSAHAVWTMDDVAGDVIEDEKERYNAIPINTVITEGHSGSARYFNGKDSYIKTSVNFKRWKGLTISLWVKPEQKDNRELSVILDNGHDAKNNFVIQSADIENPNSGRWIFHCNGVDIFLTLPFYQWTHLVVVADGKKGIIQAYTNGVNAGKVKKGGKFKFGAFPLTIGKLAKVDERYFKGSIDEVVILKRAVDAWREDKYLEE